MQDGLFLEQKPSQLDRPSWLELKGHQSRFRLPAGPKWKWGAAPASREPTTALDTPLEVGELETRPGAGSALCIARGQGTGGPTGRPTPNQPVGAASTMPLHPLDRKSGPQATPRALGGLKFPPLASLISQLIRGPLARAV